MRGVFLFFIYGIVMRTFLKLIVGIKYINKEALKKKDQFIIVSNHNSHIDTMALMSALSYSQLFKTHPVAAGDYFGSSPFKSAITKLFTNALLIPRKTTAGAQNPMRMMSDCLNRGESLILFPEGSRGEPEKMQEFKKGIGLLLKMNPGVAYIPVYMKGMGRILPKGERLLVPFDSYVTIGDPEVTTEKEIDPIVKEIEQKIVSLSKVLA